MMGTITPSLSNSEGQKNSARLAEEKLRHYFHSLQTLPATETAANDAPPKPVKIIPKMVEELQNPNTITSAPLLTAWNKTRAKKRVAPVKIKARVVMLIVSEGNDIRAKKEADMLSKAGYEITFVGRKNALTAVEKGKDDNYNIIRVPTITNAHSLRAVVRANKKHFSFIEKRLAGLIALIFQITNFSIASSGLNTPIPPSHIRKADALGERARLHRVAAMKNRSMFSYAKFSILKTLSFLTKNVVKVLAAPFVILLKLVQYPFKKMDQGIVALESRSARSWAALSTPRKLHHNIRSLMSIAGIKFIKLLNTIINTGPRKILATIGNGIKWPFIKFYNRLVAYFSPRTRLIYTLFSYFFFYLETKGAVVKENPDIIHSHDLYMLQANIKAAKAINARSIYDAHELETDRHSNVHPRIKSNIAEQERKYGLQADGVIAVSEGIAEIMNKHIGRDDTVVIFNSPIIEPSANGAKHDIRSDLGLDKNVPLAIYVGKLFGIHQHDQRIENMIEALAYIPDMHLAILGHVSNVCVNEVVQWAERFYVADRVHIVAPVPYAELVSYIRTADLGINPLQKKCISNEYSMPNKIFELTLAGIPMVQSHVIDSMDYLNRFGMGVAMDPMNAHDIARAIMEVYCDREKMRPDADTLQKMRDEFDLNAQGVKLVKLYERALANK